MGNAGSSRREAAEETSSGSDGRTLDEVSQMLQAYAGDEPTLNMSMLKPGTYQEDAEAYDAAAKLQKKRMIPTVFRWQGRHCHDVAISGSFNEWRTRIPLVRSRENFYTIVELEEGQHEYKFFVDGAWRHDERTNTTSNPHGTLNNVINVHANDLDVFEALQVESNEPISKKSIRYSTEVPTRKWIEEASGDGPAVLPPQLLEVMLNEETAYQNEPGLLPSPTHVTLNHLFALAIRDGVLVLCASHRYRKKFITSLFYKPVKIKG